MSMSRAFQGIWIPKEIWLDKNISMQAKCLWAEISSLQDDQTGEGCFASNEYLMEFLGVKLSRLKEVMKELRDNNLLETVSFDGRRRFIRAIFPTHDYGGQQTAGKPATGQPENRPSNGRNPGPPSYIENKEEIKDKNIAQSRTSCGREQRSDMHFSSSSGKFEGITQSDHDEWKASYPEIDIPREISKAQQWLLSNPSKARKKLWRKFLTGWFARANDKNENQKAYRSQAGGPSADRRTRNIDGTPVDSPVDGLF